MVKEDYRSISPKELLDKFVSFVNQDSVETLYFLSDVSSSITGENATAVLGVILDLSQSKDLFKDHLYPSVRHFIKIIAKELEKHLPGDFLWCLEEMKSEGKETKKVEDFDFYGSLKQLVLESLIKKPRKEILNSIDSYFNIGTEDLKENDEVQMIIGHLSKISPEEVGKMARHIALISSEDSLHHILGFLCENPEFSEKVLMAFFIFNKDLYEIMADVIVTEKRFFKKSLIAALPEIDVNSVIPSIKDYNWDIAECLVNLRPELAEDFIEAFNDGKIGMSRKMFIERAIAQDYAYSYFIPALNLSKEELDEALIKSERFCLRYFLEIKGESEMSDFCRIVARKDSGSVLDFIQKIQNYDNFQMLLKYLTSFMRFTSELKSYIVSNFSHDRRYFHYLISYLEWEETEDLLERHYEKGTSFEALVKRYHPQELIIEIHRIKSPELAQSLISECVDSALITDHDWRLAMKSIETVSSLELFTFQKLLVQRSSVKNEIIALLRKKTSEIKSLRSKKELDALVKCLELMKDDSLYVLECFDRNMLKMIHKSSDDFKRLLKELKTIPGSEKSINFALFKD